MTRILATQWLNDAALPLHHRWYDSSGAVAWDVCQKLFFHKGTTLSVQLTLLSEVVSMYRVMLGDMQQYTLDDLRVVDISTAMELKTMIIGWLESLTTGNRQALSLPLTGHDLATALKNLQQDNALIARAASVLSSRLGMRKKNMMLALRMDGMMKVRASMHSCRAFLRLILYPGVQALPDEALLKALMASDPQKDLVFSIEAEVAHLSRVLCCNVLA